MLFGYRIDFLTCDKAKADTPVQEERMDEKITSRENAKIKYACRLASGAAFRRTEGRFLAEGRKLCPELARGAELETLFYTENALEKCPELATLPGEHYLVEDHVADKLADVGTHQGVFGVFRTPVHTLEEVRPGGRYLALERVQDPGKVEGNPVFIYLDAFSRPEHFAEFLPEYQNLDELKAHYQRGGLGDVKIKKFLNAVMQAELEPIRNRRKEFEKDIPAIYDMLKKGCETARETAAATLDDVRKAMKINYFDDAELIAEQVKKFGGE